MSEETVTPTTPEENTSATASENTSNEPDEGEDEELLVEATEFEQQTLLLPKGMDILKHTTVFGKRGKKVGMKAEVQFASITELVNQALKNVNSTLRRVAKANGWPKEGVPYVNVSGSFIERPKTLQERIALIDWTTPKGREEGLALLEFLQREAAKHATEPETDDTQPGSTLEEMTDEQLEKATAPDAPKEEPAAQAPEATQPKPPEPRVKGRANVGHRNH